MSAGSIGKFILALIVIAAIGAGVGYKLYPEETMALKEQIMAKITGESAPSVDAKTDSAKTKASMPTEEEAVAKPIRGFEPAKELVDALSTEDALAARALGDSTAPITIYEHSSLTCGHCGKFHKDTFKELKANYIDTGKVYLIFDDFPLNGAALQATMIARCVPQDRYFDYLQLLFETQEDWAYERNYIPFLKSTARLAGLSPEGFETCINNKDLEEGIKANMKASQAKHNVSATPTFAFSTGIQRSGYLPYPAFSQLVNVELAKVGADAPVIKAE